MLTGSRRSREVTLDDLRVKRMKYSTACGKENCYQFASVNTLVGDEKSTDKDIDVVFGTCFIFIIAVYLLSSVVSLNEIADNFVGLRDERDELLNALEEKKLQLGEKVEENFNLESRVAALEETVHSLVEDVRSLKKENTTFKTFLTAQMLSAESMTANLKALLLSLEN